MIHTVLCGLQLVQSRRQAVATKSFYCHRVDGFGVDADFEPQRELRLEVWIMQ